VESRLRPLSVTSPIQEIVIKTPPYAQLQPPTKFYNSSQVRVSLIVINKTKNIKISQEILEAMSTCYLQKEYYEKTGSGER
jgi:hypothetical protein